MSVSDSAEIIKKPVRFDYRFATSLSENKEKTAIRESLVYRFAIEHAGEDKLNSITLYPVARAGKSGSEVFYLDLEILGEEFPECFIAKFQNRQKTEEEAENARKAERARMCSRVESSTHKTEDLGIIVYKLAAASDHIEFRGFFIDVANSNEACASALKSIFKEIGRRPNNQAVSKNLIDDFEWYIDRRSKPLDKIEALTSVAAAQVGIGDVATSIQEAYKRIECKLNVKVYPYLVHGDLHARNLMLSKAVPEKTELIDFGWVHYGHPAKDFVLMECTLKYMLLPELLPILKGESDGNMYIQAKFIEAFEQFISTHGFKLPSVESMLHAVFGETDVPEHQIKALSRVYFCLIEIRKAAGEALQNYCNNSRCFISPEHHYFASFFLVTIGLLGLSEIDHLWAMIGLQTVGSKL